MDLKPQFFAGGNSKGGDTKIVAFFQSFVDSAFGQTSKPTCRDSPACTRRKFALNPDKKDISLSGLIVVRCQFGFLPASGVSSAHPPIRLQPFVRFTLAKQKQFSFTPGVAQFGITSVCLPARIVIRTETSKSEWSLGFG